MSVAEGTRLMREVEGVGVLEFEDRPNGYRAYHFTTPNGQRVRLPSVTTILGATMPKHALMDWYEARGAEGAVILEREGVLAGVPPDMAIEVVRGRGVGASDFAKIAAKRGVDVHGILQSYCETGDFPGASEYPEDYRGYIRGLAAWLIKADPQPVATERLIVHPEHGYAGRTDLRATIYGTDTLCDLKTNRRAQLYPEAALQLAGYADAEERCGDGYPARLLAVAVGPDGTFSEGCPDTGVREAWRRALAHYHSLQAVQFGRVEAST
jgi:hypothetical protein